MQKKYFWITFLFILFTNTIYPQRFIPKEIKESLLTEISGELSKNYVHIISRYDRIQASQGYHESAEWIMNKLKQYGLEDAHIEKYVSDGDKKYFTWTPPMGWKIDHAELWMVSPIKKRLASYEEIPSYVVKGSRSANLTAEVIDVGTGLKDEEYEGKDVKGKVLLATGYSGDVNKEGIIKRGAAGVITYLPLDYRLGYPDLVRYTAMWPRKDENPKTGFGFNISKREGHMLKEYIKQGKKVVVKVDIEAENYPSYVEDLTCTIKGSKYPEKEIIIMGHLCHYKPGANDNASGSAAMLDMARAFKKLIDRKIIPQPKRTIRFLWVPEFYGTVPFIAFHPELKKNGIIGLNLDMVGNDIFKTNSFFYMTRTPHSLPSFLNDISEYYIKEIANSNIYSIRGTRYPFNYRIRDYSGGSDHYIFCDRSVGVPSLMFGHPDPYHHTIQDVPDNIDASELERITYLSALITYFTANAGESDVIKLADFLYSKSIGRLAGELNDVQISLEKAKTGKEAANTFRQGKIKLKYGKIREIKCIKSVLNLSEDKKVIKYVENLTEDLNHFYDNINKKFESKYNYILKEKGMKKVSWDTDPLEEKASKIVPVRKTIFTCPLSRDYLEEKLGKNFGEIDLSRNISYEVVNFINGSMNVKEITDAVSAEYGPQQLKDIYDFVKILKKADLVEFKK